jgi:pyruvate dehydrogenase E2 component (dihydrolipoamide acetyltransferase)
MAAEVVIPRLGWSMEEGTFGEWLKPDGAVIKLGDPIFVLEGEKSAQDIEAVDAGVLRIPAGAPRAGDTVLVGQVVAFLCAANETCPPLPKPGAPTSAAAPAPTAAQSPPVAAPPVAATVSAPPPVAKPAAPPPKAPVPAVAVAVRSAPVPSQSPALAPPAGPPRAASSLRVTPRARRAARRLAVDLAGIQGTGRAGRIRERDVLATPSPAQRPVGVHPVSTIRKTIAARMLTASQTTAPVTLHRRCDAGNLVNLREQFASGRAGVVVPSYTELLVKLIGCVLAEFPEVRTRFVDATTLETVAETSIAVAVDTPQGLLAPVVPRVAERPLAEVVTEVRALAARARAGELGSAELTGGVFTVTNLGALGVEYFTPVLNLPQVAILGVGAILREPVVVDDDIVIADRLPLSLTFDHRLLDGAPAARFLDAVCRAIENPAAWLVG